MTLSAYYSLPLMVMSSAVSVIGPPAVVILLPFTVSVPARIVRSDEPGPLVDGLTDADGKPVADYFNRYKRDDDDPATFATVPGWGTAADGLALVRMTHAFFKECEPRAGAVCQVMR